MSVSPMSAIFWIIIIVSDIYVSSYEQLIMNLFFFFWQLFRDIRNLNVWISVRKWVTQFKYTVTACKILVFSCTRFDLTLTQTCPGEVTVDDHIPVLSNQKLTQYGKEKTGGKENAGFYLFVFDKRILVAFLCKLYAFLTHFRWYVWTQNFISIHFQATLIYLIKP